MDGLCQCGCGQSTNIASQSHTGRGHVKGQPLRYLQSHGARKTPWPVDAGYETPCLVTDRKTRSSAATREAWERQHGAAPDGVHLDHLCFNIACVNVDHLEPVTPAENQRRRRSVKLTAEKVGEIRALLAKGWSQSRIAAAYGISQPSVSEIKTGRKWAMQERSD